MSRSGRLRRVVTGVVAGVGLAAAVAAPAFADPAGPTDYLSEVRSVEPATSTIDVGIIGGDSFFEMGVEAGTEAIVLGYEGEDYLWFRTDGVVLENQNSPATYLNADRFGNDGVPDGARADADPQWEEVAAGGYWAWHDHRAHWMQSARPFGLSAGDQILEAVIPIVVDGDTVEVTVISTWQPAPSPVPMVLGLVAGVVVGVGCMVAARPSSVAAVRGGPAGVGGTRGRTRAVPVAAGGHRPENRVVRLAADRRRVDVGRPRDGDAQPAIRRRRSAAAGGCRTGHLGVRQA